MGKVVWIPCEVKQGMFSHERYIVAHIGKREIRGLVPQEDVKDAERRVRAVVARSPRERSPDKSVALLFRGEIFPDTNPVTVEKTWLDKLTV
jgi:hypothetical protein